ncbi:hypothetical protein [Amantichitinum ursilacus]|uniref:Uncharacterized protein n=1 Tax=Amantichitinum ursilacus TaxID=857265 RepID=A0A0N0XHG7_9NEIS|nr:hypothetical protein [Amantichitinum ursilacus]KPC49542.1 hypothetical protein WG78_19500 [Amantichitinum ursilacus]
MCNRTGLTENNQHEHTDKAGDLAQEARGVKEHDDYLHDPEIGALKYIFAKLPHEKQQKFIAWMNEYIMASAVRQRLMRDKIK